MAELTPAPYTHGTTVLKGDVLRVSAGYSIGDFKAHLVLDLREVVGIEIKDCVICVDYQHHSRSVNLGMELSLNAELLAAVSNAFLYHRQPESFPDMKDPMVNLVCTQINGVELTKANKPIAEPICETPEPVAQATPEPILNPSHAHQAAYFRRAQREGVAVSFLVPPYKDKENDEWIMVNQDAWVFDWADIISVHIGSFDVLLVARDYVFDSNKYTFFRSEWLAEFAQAIQRSMEEWVRDKDVSIQMGGLEPTAFNPNQSATFDYTLYEGKESQKRQFCYIKDGLNPQSESLLSKRMVNPTIERQREFLNSHGLLMSAEHVCVPQYDDLRQPWLYHWDMVLMAKLSDERILIVTQDCVFDTALYPALNKPQLKWTFDSIMRSHASWKKQKEEIKVQQPIINPTYHQQFEYFKKRDGQLVTNMAVLPDHKSAGVEQEKNTWLFSWQDIKKAEFSPASMRLAAEDYVFDSSLYNFVDEEAQRKFVAIVQESYWKWVEFNIPSKQNSNLST